MAVNAAMSMSFEQLVQGMRAEVVAVPVADRGSERLQEMGLTLGATFTVVRIAPFGDPIEIDLRGYRLCLRKGETQGFEILPLG